MSNKPNWAKRTPQNIQSHTQPATSNRVHMPVQAGVAAQKSKSGVWYYPQNSQKLTIPPKVQPTPRQIKKRKSMVNRAGWHLNAWGDTAKRQPVPKEISATTVLGHRGAKINLRGKPKRMPWCSVSYSENIFGIRSKAYCQDANNVFAPERHEAPDLHHTCGFYAMFLEEETTYRGASYVDLLVELGGRIYAGTKGYRAQYQQVLEARIPPCFFCNEESGYMYWTEVNRRGFNHWFVCDWHHRRAKKVGFTAPRHYRDLNGLSRLSQPKLDGKWSTLADLSNKWGVPVTPMPRVPVLRDGPDYNAVRSVHEPANMVYPPAHARDCRCNLHAD